MEILRTCPGCQGQGGILIGLKFLRCERCNGRRYLSEEVPLTELFLFKFKNLKIGEKVSVPWVYVGEWKGRKKGIVTAIKGDSCTVETFLEEKYKGPLGNIPIFWNGKISDVEKISEK